MLFVYDTAISRYTIGPDCFVFCRWEVVIYTFLFTLYFSRKNAFGVLCLLPNPSSTVLAAPSVRLSMASRSRHLWLTAWPIHPLTDQHWHTYTCQATIEIIRNFRVVVLNMNSSIISENTDHCVVLCWLKPQVAISVSKKQNGVEKRRPETVTVKVYIIPVLRRVTYHTTEDCLCVVVLEEICITSWAIFHNHIYIINPWPGPL